MHRPETLGTLRQAVDAGVVPRRSVREELRDNLLAALRDGRPIFPGIVGYDETVTPQIVNAVLSRHHFILLGLRGQAKSRILRELAGLLDEAVPVIAGCQINDDPLDPLCGACRVRVDVEGDALPVAWLPRERRYVEKLATPDVTIADIVGDIDPIKAARQGLQLSDELSMHFGLLPRAHRGIFAINELPDLAGKIQVGLFNILQEGDVQIKGYPVRLPLDLLMVFTANPEDYTARGKIITPLKDRIGSEIRTHYPVTRSAGMAITAQEAWLARQRNGTPSSAEIPLDVPDFVREVVEEVAFQAREDKRIDKRSGVSQRLPISCLENVVSNAERRAVLAGEPLAVPRITDVYAALPSITGKFELEYEGELRGAASVATDLVRSAVANVFNGYFEDADLRPVVEWFDLGGRLESGDAVPAAELVAGAAQIQGIEALTGRTGIPGDAPAPRLAAALDFVLEGLYALKRISRSDQWTYQAAEKPRRRGQSIETLIDEAEPIPPGRKKYYN